MARISVSPTDSVAPEASVAHYDQLVGPAKDRFPELVARQSATVNAQTAAELLQCEFVKFTDYYRVELD